MVRVHLHFVIALYRFGAIHKVRTLRFRNTLPSRIRARISFFKRRYGRYVFCELQSIKEPHTTLQNKETTVPSYRKMSNQNKNNSPVIKIALFNCTGGWEWIILAIWMAHSFYFIFGLGRTCEIKSWRTYAYSWTSPSPIRASMRLTGLPLHPLTFISKFLHILLTTVHFTDRN